MKRQSKKCISRVFSFGHHQSHDFLETEHTGEEDGSAIDGKGQKESNHPMDVKLLGQQSDYYDAGKENRDVYPITSAEFELEDAFGNNEL